MRAVTEGGSEGGVEEREGGREGGRRETKLIEIERGRQYDELSTELRTLDCNTNKENTHSRDFP